MLERSEFHLPSSNAITPLKQEKSRERVRSFAFQNKMFHLPSIKQSKAEALSGSSNPWQPSAPVWFCRMSQKRSSSQVDVELVFVFNLCMSLYMTGLSFLLSIYVLVGMLPSLQWFPLSSSLLVSFWLHCCCDVIPEGSHPLVRRVPNSTFLDCSKPTAGGEVIRGPESRTKSWGQSAG